MSNAIPPLGHQNFIRNLALGVKTPHADTAPATTPAARAGDEADIDSSLSRVKSLLAELDERTAALADAKSPSKEAQAKIDSILASIDSVVSGVGASRSSGSGFEVGNVAPEVNKFTVFDADVDPGESLDVHVAVTQSAQKAVLFLSLGGALDLSAVDARFSFELAGKNGAQTLVFASGSSQLTLVDTINSFSDHTGVVASLSGTGVRLDSIGFGDDDFMSVRVIDSGGLNQAVATAGVFQYASTDTSVVSAATGVLFSDIIEPVTDRGQDLAAVVNGVEARTDGLFLSVHSPVLRATITLSEIAGQSPGKFTAFTITGKEETSGDALAKQVRSSLGLIE